VVEHLPSKHEAPSSNRSTKKKLEEIASVPKVKPRKSRVSTLSGSSYITTEAAAGGLTVILGCRLKFLGI
jgi:hypothetical protein